MDSNDDGDVGYKRPPKHTQFKRGARSPNPAGRPRGSTKNASMAKHLRKALARSVTVRDPHGVRAESTLNVAIEQLVNDALKGNMPAMARLIKLADRYGILQPDESAGPRTGVFYVAGVMSPAENEAALRDPEFRRRQGLRPLP